MWNMAMIYVSTLFALKEKFLRWVWARAVTLARTAVLRIFANLEVGTLLIIDEASATEYAFGQVPSNGNSQNGTAENNPSVPDVKIVAKRDTFWFRLLLFADIGFAESYMLGNIECNDLLFILNQDRLNGGATAFSALSSMVSRLGRSRNTLANSLVNAATHYDISNDMFSAFLSRDMTYSCPIWQQGHASLDGSGEKIESLEDAQRTKLLRFIRGARLKAGDHVLEIGTGWGSFAIEAVKQKGCRVTTITLSRKQLELAEQRIRFAGLSHRITVKLMDYREISAAGETFDKIVSIEMIESVGESHLAEYFAAVHRLLKQDGGIAMFQCTTIPEALHKANEKKTGFIEQYIFPGGYLPSTLQLLNHISRQSKGGLTLESVENIGGHYVKALRLWRESFLCNFEDKIKPALLNDHPTMSKLDIEVFRRKWEYYFAYCEAGFSMRILEDVIISVGRAGAFELVEGIPI
ncbi:Mycolic acid cyclopropane synthetase-domain-containing protein [Diaporthe sp. PMI_573]|nr:Mycolic acid cyclopropane synthetase-domain-containing protein [Diaporthaceae sp. PMI_573]